MAKGTCWPWTDRTRTGGKVAGHKGTVVVEYTLFGDRADGTYDGIDATHAHLNMPATFVWAHGMEKAPASFRFVIPDGSKWEVATQLAPQADGTYLAPNVDMMMDSPVEISAHFLEEWKVGDRQFRMSLHDQGTKEEAGGLRADGTGCGDGGGGRVRGVSAV